MERCRGRIWKTKKTESESGRMEEKKTKQGGCVTARSVWSLCKIACVRGVCEILVGWWSRTDQVRTEGSGNSSRFMNQQWKSSPRLSASPPRIIWIKPSSWSHKTPCPTTCWAAGATLYVILPTHCATHISLHLSSHRQTANLWRLTCLRGLPLLTHPRFPLIHSHCLGFCDVCFPLCDIHRKRYRRLTAAIVCF